MENDIYYTDDIEKILTDQEYYFQYIKQLVNDIITSENLTYKGTNDPNRIGAIFTYNQFLYILERVKNLFYIPNKKRVLMRQDAPNYFDFEKVLKAWDVYVKISYFYGYNCVLETFLNNFLGAPDRLLLDAMQTQYGKEVRQMVKKVRDGLFANMENDNNAIIKLAIANNKYKLESYNENIEPGRAVVAELPDLKKFMIEGKEG